jgi:cyclase
MGRKLPALAAAGLPVITFAQGLNINFNGEEIHAVYAPGGHTDGDTIVHFATSKVVHMGDDFTNGMYPFIDLEAGGGIQGYLKTSEMALKQFPQDTKFIPGHGPLATYADLQKFHRMIQESIATVKAGIDAGKSLEDIQKAGMNEEWKSWGAAFINNSQWIQLVYGSLKGKG